MSHSTTGKINGPKCSKKEKTNGILCRLGPLGFLGTSDKAAGGNQGLLDQIMVLNWVKENIAKFGGDPDKVTMFGEDSGAASVTLMAMSEKAKGLFHGAIALSGNALCDQYLQNEPQEASRELATRLECTTDTGKDIINCLKRKSQQEIITAAQQMFVSWSTRCRKMSLIF